MYIPKSNVKAIRSHLKRIVENARADASDTRTVNALRLARRDLRLLDKYLTMEDKFKNNELCDGRNCAARSTCVRYMANVDSDSEIINTYVILNSIARPKGCEYYLRKDNGHYPQIRE